jgi:CubicO group peptidase (beta-lactamase class C family)
MDRWLSSALDYIPEWLAFQMRMSEQPGCIVAIAHRGRVVLERAWGAADLATGQPPDAAAPLSHRLAYQELHRRRHPEAARAG